MGAKDTALKSLLQHPDVFADVVNFGLYSGKQIVDPSYLRATAINSIFEVPQNNSLHEQSRDVAMFDVREGITYCLYGIENESKQAPYEVLRSFSYDGAGYFDQITKARKDSSFKFYPVVTLVLNYTDTKWSQPRTVHELLHITESDPRYKFVNNYRLNVVDVPFLSVEERSMLISEFKAVCAILNFAYNGGTFPAWEFANSVYSHFNELVHVVDAFKDKGALWDEFYKDRGGSSMASEWLKQYVKDVTDDATKKGIQQGIRQGQQDVLQEIMHTYGWTQVQLADFLKGHIPTTTEGTSSTTLKPMPKLGKKDN